jgi:DNA-binding NarL/FixJ family response regulator
MTTYLIVDDHAAFRKQARALLEAEGLPVVGEASDAASAIAAVTDLEPGVVLLDIGLPDRDGFAVAAELRGLPRPPLVVLISSREASDLQPRLDHAAADGFIQKDDLSAAALAAILGTD